MNIDIKNIMCFGFSVPRKDSWFMQLHKVSSNGWKSIDQDKFETNLGINVKNAYDAMVKIEFKDLDTEFDYVVAFNNQLGRWEMSLPGSSEDAVDKADKTAFFKSKEFKKTCIRADEILTTAYKSCFNIIMPEVRKGRFINIDEIKLEAVMHMLDDPKFRKNLKHGKHV